MLVSLICFAISAIAIAAAGGTQFVSGVNLVEVYATVLDERDEPVGGLSADDFQVDEDGRRQRIEAFSAGDFPLSLAIAVDHSFSVSRGQLRDEISAVQRLLGDLREQDRVMLLAMGSQVEVLAPLSIDHRAPSDALRDLQPWGTTPLFDAALEAINAVQGASGRRALVLISDGNDRYSQVNAAEMLAQARARDVLVYPVVLQRAVPPVLVELALATGGRAVAVADTRALSSSLVAIANELRHQYLIGYAPQGAEAGVAGWRAITVRVRRPNLRVRARDGYYATR